MMQPVILSLQISVLSTILLLILVPPCAWWLSQSQHHRRKFIIESILNLPLILPPAVLGFYLLLLFGQNGPLWFLKLAFSFHGLVIAAIIYCFPFVLQPLLVSFHALPQNMLEAAKIDGTSSLQQFLHLGLPLSRKGLVRGALLGFSHTMGAFGIMLIVGGAISGKTKVVSVTLWEKIETGDYQGAHFYALILAIISLSIFIFAKFLEKDEK